MAAVGVGRYLQRTQAAANPVGGSWSRQDGKHFCPEMKHTEAEDETSPAQVSRRQQQRSTDPALFTAGGQSPELGSGLLEPPPPSELGPDWLAAAAEPPTEVELAGFLPAGRPSALATCFSIDWEESGSVITHGNPIPRVCRFAIPGAISSTKSCKGAAELGLVRVWPGAGTSESEDEEL